MSNPEYWIAGNTHIDLAWKKDSSEMAELLEIFVVRLLDILETNPSFTYTIEQAAHYRNLAKRRPDLIAHLRKFFQEGRLEFVGGLASTLETNATNGESFVRNQILGLKWVRDNFGTDVQTGWLIDTFGVNAQIPQILHQFGIRHLIANRLGGAINHDVFRSHGLDGSEIIVAGRDVYSPYVQSRNIFFKYVRSWNDIDDLFSEASSTAKEGACLIIPYTENEVLPSLRPVYHVEKGNSCSKKGWHFGVPRDYFKALESMDRVWPVIYGDLNPEFTGTFGQRAIIRQRNRRIETLLLEAEKWASLLRLSGWREDLEQAWWDMSFIHSHDVFTGSHPTKVLNDALSILDRIEECARNILGRAFNTQSSAAVEPEWLSILAFNGLPWTRDEIISLPLPCGARGVSSVIDGENNDIPFENINGKIEFRAEVPAVGIKAFKIKTGPAGGRPLLRKADESVIENEYIRLECDTQSGIRQLVWKETGEVLIVNSGDFLVVQEDRGNFQIEEPVGSEVPAIAGEVQIQEQTSSGLKRDIIMSGVFPVLGWAGEGNTLSWDARFSLIPGKPRLDVTLQLHWTGEASRIRFKLPTTVDSSEGIYEIPFGTIRRKPYSLRRTARGEWPVHRFVIVEGQGKGLALVNTGTCGVEVNGGTIWTTLLRAPKTEYAGMVPDGTSSQHGTHTFHFSIIPYAGTWTKAGVVEMAQEVNSPILATACQGVDAGCLKGKSFMTLIPSTVVLSSIKAPEDGSDELIVRFYETAGQECMAALWLSGAQEAWLSNLSESKLGPVKCLNERIEVPMRPFEIKTLRIRRQ